MDIGVACEISLYVSKLMFGVEYSHLEGQARKYLVNGVYIK